MQGSRWKEVVIQGSRCPSAHAEEAEWVPIMAHLQIGRSWHRVGKFPCTTTLDCLSKESHSLNDCWTVLFIIGRVPYVHDLKPSFKQTYEPCSNIEPVFD